MTRSDMLLAFIRESEAQMERILGEIATAKGLTLAAWQVALDTEKKRIELLEAEIARL